MVEAYIDTERTWERQDRRMVIQIIEKVSILYANYTLNKLI
jgi:hypothetical protein